MDSTSGDAITAMLYSEANAKPILANGTDVTSGSPTGEGEDETIAIVLDTLTGITLTEDTWFELVVYNDAGVAYLPNAITADRIMVLLRAFPS